MPSVFTLFGELKADTGQFERALKNSQSELAKTEQASKQTEIKAKSLGQTSATVARGFEKLNQALATEKQRLSDAAAAFNKGEISAKRYAAAISQVDRRVASLNSRLKDQVAKLNDLPVAASRAQKAIKGVVSDLPSVSTYVGIAGTLIGGYVLKAGSDLENLKNRFQALEGSSEKAAQRVQKLLALSRQSVGVTFKDAGEAFAFLRPLKISEQSIDGITKALGRLKLGFSATMLSSTDFLINMQQLFDQNFEQTDLKQAIGRVPIFYDLLKQAFRTADKKILREMKDSGELTFDSWIGGFANAVNSNETLGRLNETFSTRLSKALGELNIAAAPLGQRILDQLRPQLEAAIKGLQEGNYDAVGGAIGTTLGQAIGTALKGALTTEIGNIQTGSFWGSVGEGILQGFNADTAGTAVLMFFNKVNFEVLRGINDLTALIYSISVGPAGSLADYLLTKLGFAVDESNSLNQKIKSYFRSFGETINAEYEKQSIDILKGSKAAFQKIAADTTATEAVRQNAQKQVEAITREIEAASARMNTSLDRAGAEAGKRTYQSVLKTIPEGGPQISQTLNETVRNATRDAKEEGAKGGSDVGLAIAQGLIAGLSTGQGGVIGAAVGLATAAYQSAKNALCCESPSKKFFAIGKDTAQGFIDGLESLKTGVQAKMASLLDISGIKSLAKKDSPGVILLSSLIRELDSLAPRTKLQEVRAELTAGKYAKLNAQVKQRIDLAATEIDRLNSVTRGMDGLQSVFDNLVTVDKTELEKLTEALAGKDAQAALAAMNPLLRGIYENYLRVIAIRKDIGSIGELGGANLPDNPQGTGADSSIYGPDGELAPFGVADNTLPPPPQKTWEDFWGMMRQRTLEWQAQLPSLKNAIGENLIASIQDIGNVFGNAVLRWDGTIRGFFTSVAQGFAQMARQIIADLVRIAIQALITKVLTAAFSGGFGGGGASGAGSGISLGGSNSFFGSSLPNPFASGGFPQLNKLALVGERGPELFVPTVPGRVYSSNDTQAMLGTQQQQQPIIVNNNFYPNQNGMFSKESAEQAARRSAAALNRAVLRENGWPS